MLCVVFLIRYARGAGSQSDWNEHQSENCRLLLRNVSACGQCRELGPFDCVEANPETENPIPEILDRFPPEDYEDLPFTENAEFVIVLPRFDSVVLSSRGR